MWNETKPSIYIKHNFTCNLLHNFTSNLLSDEWHKALSYGLDHHVLTFSKYNDVETEY